jgi:N-acyl-L-homoserine lactone synthetase
MNTSIARTEELIKICYRMRYDVMCQELGWISDDRATPEERDEYDNEQSIHFLALDDINVPIGTSRLIIEGAIKLPIERFFKINSRNAIAEAYGEITSFAEGSRFIVPRNSKYRRHEVSISMCNALIGMCLDLGISHMFVSADYKVFRLLRMIGFPLEQVGESRHYMGSETVPSIVSIAGWDGILEKEYEHKPTLQEV